MDSVDVILKCQQCYKELQVKGNVFDEAELEEMTEEITYNEMPMIQEAITCPNCGADNIWDRRKREFVNLD